MDDVSLEHTQVLFGSDATENIVAAVLAGRFIRLFMRTGRGVVFHDDPFHPFILLETARLITGFGRPVSLRELSGPGEYRVQATFRDWGDCIAARDFLARRTGKTPSAADAPYLFLSDPVHQHLLITGKTLFKGMDFEQLRRLALDIETDCARGFEFSNPAREADRIISIAVMDSTGYREVLSGRVLDEGPMLERLSAIIRARDPDVLEGHNLFRFDLEYLRIRAARLGVRLAWGRDGSEPKVRQSRFTVAERSIDYPRYDIYGRHVLDTYFLVQIHDVGARDMESYGLKAAAAHFGLAAPDRVYLDRSAIRSVYEDDPDTLSRYNLDDVRETLALSGLLSRSYFLQTRIFPYSYQNCIIRGTGTRINSLFMREYLRQGVAIPRAPGGGGGFEGGYTDVFIHGVVGPIVHCDVASLYPSLMLSHGVRPSKDPLGLFLPLLAGLREFRLAAKKRGREESDPGRREYFNALQQTFKVLINSFYGYLGAPLHNFSDPAAAALTARLGRETITAMVDWLQQRKARPVEIDTDGIYFIPPPGIDSPEREDAFVAQLAAALPAGIQVETDGRYRSMFSYKSKNYALLGYDGAVQVKGSALRSRGMENYLRDFMGEVIGHLLRGEKDRARAVYDDYCRRLKDYAFAVSWLAKTETLGESPATYRQKVAKGQRNRSAAYELAARSDHEYRAGDQLSYYVTGTGKRVVSCENCKLAKSYDPDRPDVNLEFYLDRLAQVKKKFAPFLEVENPLFSWCSGDEGL
jgi:DNA polymerase I